MSANSDLKNALNELIFPGLRQKLGELAVIRRAEVGSASATLEIDLKIPAASEISTLERIVSKAVEATTGIARTEVAWATRIPSHGVQHNLKPLENVRNIIAVASGKGGVGKSTVAVNMALALSQEGANVGMLDADIYGPSQPLMLGVADNRPVSEDGQSLEPVTGHGLQVMSIGFLIDPDQPMVWRGPMVTGALNQMLTQTNWSDLDYLIVDMPPGTGDIQLTLAQQVPVSGAVIVTTPQDIALLDARKGLQMFKKVSVPILGVIENMSTHICPSCGHEEHLFGAGGGATMAHDFDVELLGQLPLDLRIREQTDSGTPTVIAEPDGGIAAAYRLAARRMAARLAMQGKDYSHRFPKIVVEDS